MILGWVIVGAFSLYIVFSLFYFFFSDPCGNDEIKKFPSPNGEKVAYVFRRSCGATTGFWTQVSILNKEDSFKNQAGNVFVSNDDGNIIVKWLNNHKLKITYHTTSGNGGKKKYEVNDVKIEYRMIK